MDTVRKLRILCLHGMVQNGPVFRKKTAVIRKKLADVAELVYITAPHLIVDPRYTSEAHRTAALDETASLESKPYGWWHPTKESAETGEEEMQYKGLMESMEYLKTVLVEEGPFDGVFGFSQGAGLAAVLTALLEGRTETDLMPLDFAHPPLKFAMICAGFKLTRPPAAVRLLTHPLTTPSMHIYGTQDTLIVPEKATALAAVFDRPVLLTHTGGHVVPSNAVCRNALLVFVTQFTVASAAL
ncbi:serine hydrolase FSH [Spinellus fusiger]|nr:serine hydrolase FSH [Spinellus fusiger]